MKPTPIHPGEHLAEELKELGITAAEFARQIDVPTNRVTQIINGKRAISGDTALPTFSARPPNSGSIFRASTSCAWLRASQAKPSRHCERSKTCL